MRRTCFAVVILAIFMAGAYTGVSYAKEKKIVDSGLYVGAEAAAAADNLYRLALEEAGDGTFQRLRVARSMIQAGKTAQGQEIIDQVMAGEHEAGDLIRIARIYAEAGDWERARPLFDQALELKPKYEDWMIEIGAYDNLHGDREHAEELFQRGFALDPDSHKNLAVAAGSYLGVSPPQ